MDDLRRDNVKLREALAEREGEIRARDTEIDRLQRMCFMNRIDPKTGRALRRNEDDGTAPSNTADSNDAR